jgi:hypothetical protein
VGFNPLFPSICDWMSWTLLAVRAYFLPRKVTMTLTGAWREGVREGSVRIFLCPSLPAYSIHEQ